METCSFVTALPQFSVHEEDKTVQEHLYIRQDMVPGSSGIIIGYMINYYVFFLSLLTHLNFTCIANVTYFCFGRHGCSDSVETRKYVKLSEKLPLQQPDCGPRRTNRDVSLVGCMLSSCLQLAKIYHGTLVKENSF
jgi:hypothetical protein